MRNHTMEPIIERTLLKNFILWLVTMLLFIGVIRVVICPLDSVSHDRLQEHSEFDRHAYEVMW